jgi:hypothetical protein
MSSLGSLRDYSEPRQHVIVPQLLLTNARNAAATATSGNLSVGHISSFMALHVLIVKYLENNQTALNADISCH